MRGFLLCVTILYTAIGLPYSIHYSYQLDRDLDAVINRAQVAASAEDMLKYMQMYKSNLEKLDATSGHTVFIFKTLENDLTILKTECE